LRNRDVYIEDSVELTDAQTKVIDLDLRDPVSALWIEYQAQNGSTHNMANPLHRCVSKIELVDGADVLASMSLPEWQALNFYENKALPMLNLTEEPNDYPREGCWINFGRFLNDPSYYLDPNAFRNLQLRLTHDMEAVRDVSATTAYVTGSAKVSIIAKVMEDVEGAPLGFMMAKNHYSWTTAASGEERIDLPTDYPYRFLLVRSYEAGMGPWENISDLKLSIDQDKYVVFNLETKNLETMNMNQFGSVVIGGKWWCKNATDIYFPLYRVDGASICIKGGTDIIGMTYCWTGFASIVRADNAGVAIATEAGAFVLVNGATFQSAVVWPFGDPDTPAQYLPAPEYGSIRLIADQKDAGAAASVCIQQVRSY